MTVSGQVGTFACEGHPCQRAVRAERRRKWAAVIRDFSTPIPYLMSELALKLIRENIEKHERGEDARFLDLGNCGMTEVPEEIGECVWVEELNLSNQWDEDDFEHSVRRKSSNTGSPNSIARLPKSLASITKLKKIRVAKNYSEQEDWSLNDLSPLTTLSALNWLDLSHTKVSDLQPLANLIALKVLDCFGTEIIDLSPISQLRNLEDLSISNTKISDLLPISQLRKLKRLSISNTEVLDISPLSNLIKLEELTMINCKASHISSLENLVSLKRLTMFLSKVSDLSPLSKLHNLTHLHCARNPNIIDLLPISTLTKLEFLGLQGTSILETV